MYRNYFGLAEAPFSIAPDPRYLYMSQRHQEALAHLLFGVTAGGGFVLLTGEVGTGKTTICRCLLEQMPDSCDVAYIFNPRLSVEELLSTVCGEFRIAYPPGNTSIKQFVDLINARLLDTHAQGRRSVLIIDEAQNLSPEVLEQMRLLTNLETSQHKLLQIILLGQPELGAMLARPELRQLAQRVVARYHLGPLSRAEVAAYVRHRLDVSGAQRQLFPPPLLKRMHRLTGGIPRIINVLCDRALLGAYVQGKERVDRVTLTRAAREIFGHARARLLPRIVAASLVLLAGIAFAAAGYQPGTKEPPPPVVRRTALPPVAAKHDPTPSKPTASAGTSASNVLPAPATSLQWPTGESEAHSRTTAYASLFKTWGAEYLGADPCPHAQKMGLRCLTGRGGLDELRRMNRPAILHMRDEQGSDFYATLVGLDDNSATFTVGASTKRVALAALAQQWSGFYTMLWRDPPPLGGRFKAGDRGPAVEWLDARLAQALPSGTARGNQAVFDSELLLRVKEFQLAQGLVPDGAAGPQTLQRLASATDESAPVLWRQRKED